MISCRKASELSSLAQDKRLTLTQKMQMKTHLLLCSACRNFSKNMTSLSAAMEAFRGNNGESKEDSDSSEGDKG